MGYYRKRVLRVDLDDGTVESEPIPEEYVRKFVGGWGLGLRMLVDEVPLGISPTDPENPLLLMTGPLTGVPLVPAATNLTVCTLNANTGYTAGRAHTHGWFGPYVKFAGYDGLVITGRAEEPTYLWIDGETDDVELRDATDIWGADTHETEDLVKEDVGNPEASVAAIGPAGERQVFGALIENDKNHHASHSGVGVVMGSKNLKAIGVYGENDLELADEAAFEEVVKQWRGNLFEEETPKPTGTAAAGIRLGGHHREYVKHYTEDGMLVTKNLSEKGGSDFGEGMTEQNVTPKPCWKCPIACSYDVEVTDGPYEGYSSTLSGGVEGLEAGGSIMGITEPGAIFRMTDHYDRYGLEATSIGCSLAVAFEAFQRGEIDEEDTDGLVLEWGDEDAAMALLDKTVEKEGIGEILAKGPKRAAHLLGVPDAAVHTKGAPINLHDWRKRWGTLLGQVVGGGAGWPAPGMSLRAEPSLGYEERDDPVDPTGKPKTVRESGNKKFWDDSIGVCWFGVWGVQDIVDLSREAIEAATGTVVRDDPLLVGERITNLERVFNVERGLTPEDDYGDVGQRLLDPIPEGDEFSGVSFEPTSRGSWRSTTARWGGTSRRGAPTDRPSTGWTWTSSRTGSGSRGADPRLRTGDDDSRIRRPPGASSGAITRWTTVAVHGSSFEESTRSSANSETTSGCSRAAFASSCSASRLTIAASSSRASASARSATSFPCATATSPSARHPYRRTNMSSWSRRSTSALSRSDSGRSETSAARAAAALFWTWWSSSSLTTSTSSGHRSRTRSGCSSARGTRVQAACSRTTGRPPSIRSSSAADSCSPYAWAIETRVRPAVR